MGSSTKEKLRRTTLSLEQREPEPVGSGSRSGILGATALAAVLYGWGLSRGASDYYFSAAVRSMTLNWHNFFFGAFDPPGSITTDKLPGSLWLQALFARVLGLHTWVLLLPALLAAVATVPLLFGAVRRWAGERAGFIAVGVYLLTPAVFATAQVNLPDPVLMFCVVTAGYCLIRAMTSANWGWLVLSALLVGFGYQVKMTVALLTLPAFALTYLVGADKPLRTRVVAAIGHVVVALAAALSWATVFSLVPAGSRPRIDGSVTDSVWDMLFVYNGIGRTATSQATAMSSAFAGPAGATRLFDVKVAGEASWLLPLVVVLGVAGLWAARRGGRRAVAGWLMWLAWLALYGVAFSKVSQMHPYYMTLMVPPIAALAGAGIDTAWTAWRSRAALGWLLPVGVALSAVWAVVVLVRVPVGLGWLAPVIAVAGAVAVVVFALGQFRPFRRGGVVGLAALATAVALLAGPSVWLFSTPSLAANPGRAVDPVAGPPAFVNADGGDSVSEDLPMLNYARAHSSGERFVFASNLGITAAPYIDAGENVMSLLGFTGLSQAPSPAQLTGMVEGYQFRYVLMVAMPDPTTSMTAIRNWVRGHCGLVPVSAYNPSGRTGGQWTKLYDCAPRPVPGRR